MKRTILLFTAVVFLVQVPDSVSALQGQLQTVVITVRDNVGRYILNLQRDALIVEENGVPQQISTFTEDSSLPISLGILIDKSASMRLPVAVVNQQKMPAALLAADGAARVVLTLTKPQDEFLFMTFDEGFQVKQSFTSDKKKLTELLNKNTTVGGGTHLYKNVGEALKEIKKKAKNPRRALIVITDVHDTSGHKIEDLQATIREQEIPVYTFGMRWDAWGVPGQDADPGKSTYEVEVLKMMASDSGGYAMVVDIPDLLSDFTVGRMIEFVRTIEAELRGQYTLTYYSSTPGPSEGKALRVRSTDPALQVRARRESAGKPASPSKR